MAVGGNTENEAVQWYPEEDNRHRPCRFKNVLSETMVEGYDIAYPLMPWNMRRQKGKRGGQVAS
jgi:hypothetical protein